jgi:6-phosphogluconolactonase
MNRTLLAAAVLLLAGSALALAAAPPRAVRVYVGTYTAGDSTSKGIYRLRLDLLTGALSEEGPPTKTVNPSFLALHPNGRFLYAVNEVGERREDTGGAVSAFAVDARTGALRLLNTQPSGGAAPCHLTVDKAGRNVLVANYAGGSVAVLPIAPDGQLRPAATVVQHEGKSVNADRQTGPHAHSITLDSDNTFALAADLGIDKVLAYRFDTARGTLTAGAPVPLAPGSGPRHVAFHPDGRRAYVINELLSTVTAFDYDRATGGLSERQTVSTLPADFKGANFTAEVVVHPEGKFLYGSNRGHDSIAIFAIDPATGKLTPAGHRPTQGQWPRNFAIDPTGTFLLAANQRSDSIVVFRIDRATGQLQEEGKPFPLPQPVCLRMVALPD